MNLEALLRGATVVREFIDNPQHNDGQRVEPRVVLLEFAWLQDFSDALKEW